MNILCMLNQDRLSASNMDTQKAYHAVNRV